MNIIFGEGKKSLSKKKEIYKEIIRVIFVNDRQIRIFGEISKENGEKRIDNFFLKNYKNKNIFLTVISLFFFIFE